MKKPSESDWKLYSNLIPTWRDRCLQNKNDKLVALLSVHDKTPTEKFWEVKGRIDEEAKMLSQCLDGRSRSKMWMSMLLMYRFGLVLDEDLEQFSESLRAEIRGFDNGADSGTRTRTLP